MRDVRIFSTSRTYDREKEGGDGDGEDEDLHASRYSRWYRTYIRLLSTSNNGGGAVRRRRSPRRSARTTPRLR
ncbi:hypothetical protein GUJ93_ZPchr0001g29671 [Zizania palustris]|uniref:Uncharacterized protein n=1 Tax=Zizania palustris TaxID=103762 RepID=A0A8J5RTL0_ZIZPA|nr:hypothetical protein GUJ93_ZPchr0001g29671 [Zizania palustris]